MSAFSSIEWTDKTWNPVAGCTRVSVGCDNCYAARLAATRMKHTRQHGGLATITPRGRAAFNGTIRLLPERLEDPLRWRDPVRVFVNSLSDLFHEDVPEEFIDQVFAVMAVSEHTFQVLTKRPARMLEYMTTPGRAGAIAAETGIGTALPRLPFIRSDDLAARWPLRNVWLGVSTEDQLTADERIPLLLRTPAAVRWISAEPLLGPLSLVTYLRRMPWYPIECEHGYDHCPRCDATAGKALDWVVVGGESGPVARRCDLAWIRGIVQQCQLAGVPVFVKQLGAMPTMGEAEWRALRGPVPLLSATKSLKPEIVEAGRVVIVQSSAKGGEPAEWPADLRVRQFPRERVA